MRKRVLLIIESCNPEWASVPLVGYNFFNQIIDFADVTLVTHERNRAALSKSNPKANIIYIQPSKLEKIYYKVIARLSSFRGAVIWPLRHALQYPIYFFFDRAVDRQFREQVEAGTFDIVHALTPILPRYPVKISKRCLKTPFLLGPVNGGVPFPDAFKERGKKEFSQLNFLRKIGAAILPNYRATYQKAALVLSGSTYTKQWIENNLHIPSKKVELFFENGVAQSFYKSPEASSENSPTAQIKALFIGRLVPYKGADMLLKALKKTNDIIHLTIVGDGPEKSNLESLAERLELKNRVTFTGWIAQNETTRYYQNSDIFCFPSVREFGGAVVMEAMASGLPCIVVDNGGLSEYVTESCGYKIPPNGEDFVIDKLADTLNHLARNQGDLKEKSAAAYTRAIDFSWGRKRDLLNEIYERLCRDA